MNPDEFPVFPDDEPAVAEVVSDPWKPVSDTVEQLRALLRPDLPPFAPGTVIRYSVRYSPGGTLYTYVAIYVNRHWYRTGGQRGSSPLSVTTTTAELLESLTDERIESVEVAVGWEKVR